MLSSTFKKNCIVLAALLSVSCSVVSKHQAHFIAFDTAIDVTVYSASRNTDDDIDLLKDLFARLEDKLSISKQESEIYRINTRQDSIVIVSDTLKSILKICRTEFSRSGGLFDVTVEPLKYLYGLEAHQAQTHVPTQHELDSVLSFIGFGRIKFVSDSILMLPREVTLDFGGIAKGYALEAAKQFLRAKGYTSFMINAGGDLIAEGTKPAGVPWRIGIQNPRAHGNLVATLQIADRCVFTSGDYERCFFKDGVRYHHLFDPRTGKPGRLNMSSTVVGKDPLTTDADVKIAFLQLPEKGLEYCTSKGLPALLIDSTGTAWANELMKPFLRPDSAFVVNYR
jgi:thiamine biosynthesis lipoprotein